MQPESLKRIRTGCRCKWGPIKSKKIKYDDSLTKSIEIHRPAFVNLYKENLYSSLLPKFFLSHFSARIEVENRSSFVIFSIVTHAFTQNSGVDRLNEINKESGGGHGSDN